MERGKVSVSSSSNVWVSKYVYALALDSSQRVRPIQDRILVDYQSYFPPFDDSLSMLPISVPLERCTQRYGR